MNHKHIYLDRGERDNNRSPAASQDGQMGDAKTQRYEDALSSLVDNLVPSLEDDDDAAADDRHETALDLARNILEE